MRRRRGISIVLLLATLVLPAGGCGGDGSSRPPRETLAGQESPAECLEELVASWQTLDLQSYLNQLSYDFQYSFAGEVSLECAPDTWGRDADSVATRALFRDPTLRDVRVHLTYGSDRSVNQFGRESWRQIQVTDTFLEVDLLPAADAEILTYRVDGDLQQLYFRRGRTPTDTLASSPTASRWFITEWRDLGRSRSARRPGAETPLPVVARSWGEIKARCVVDYGRARE